MRFIIDTIKLFFGKENKEKQKRILNLTKNQKKYYRKQYWSIMVPTTLLTLVLIASAGELIINFLTKGTWASLGLTIITVWFMIMKLEETKKEIELIEERIQRRCSKNKKVRIERNE